MISRSLETPAIGRGSRRWLRQYPFRLDTVDREDLSDVEGDDRDLLLVGDGEDAPAGAGTVPTFRAVQAAGARRVMALAVGDVAAEADVD